ncbi:hypothetical protein [Burkholderia sp. BCC0405]|uniref:hypothetical protein n=1 Tax=Burkholderia sp. BCC0405 TaxID=2676298 RepID=UPI001589634F|nr:hypothetical protein [Burkholderia sp. BCC0405]
MYNTVAAMLVTLTEVDIHVLIAGLNTGEVADAAPSRMLVADALKLAEGIVENIEATVLTITKSHLHILAS